MELRKTPALALMRGETKECGMMRKKRDIDTIVRELDARQQIHDVIMRYCRGNDHRDEALMRSVYHAGATDDHGFFSGSAEEFVAIAVRSGPECINKRHIICNEYVEFDDHDPNIAYSETVTIGCMTRPSGDSFLVSLSACRYLDRFECRDGEWRIAERRLVLDWEAQLPSTGNAGSRLTTGMLRGLVSMSDPSYGLGFRRWGDGPAPAISNERTTGAKQPAEKHA